MTIETMARLKAMASRALFAEQFDPEKHVIVYGDGGDHCGVDGKVKCRETGKMTDWHVEGHGDGDLDQRRCIVETFNWSGWTL